MLTPKGRAAQAFPLLTSLLTSFFSFAADLSGDARGAGALTGDDEVEAMMDSHGQSKV